MSNCDDCRNQSIAYAVGGDFEHFEVCQSCEEYQDDGAVKGERDYVCVYVYVCVSTGTEPVWNMTWLIGCQFGDAVTKWQERLIDQCRFLCTETLDLCNDSTKHNQNLMIANTHQKVLDNIVFAPDFLSRSEPAKSTIDRTLFCIPSAYWRLTWIRNTACDLWFYHTIKQMKIRKKYSQPSHHQISWERWFEKKCEEAWKPGAGFVGVCCTLGSMCISRMQSINDFVNRVHTDPCESRNKHPEFRIFANFEITGRIGWIQKIFHSLTIHLQKSPDFIQIIASPSLPGTIISLPPLSRKIECQTDFEKRNRQFRILLTAQYPKQLLNNQDHDSRIFWLPDHRVSLACK